MTRLNEIANDAMMKFVIDLMAHCGFTRVDDAVKEVNRMLFEYEIRVTDPIWRENVAGYEVRYRCHNEKYGKMMRKAGRGNLKDHAEWIHGGIVSVSPDIAAKMYQRAKNSKSKKDT